MHFDPFLRELVGAILVILSVGIAVRLLRQPAVVGYLISGILLGPSGFAFLSEYEMLERLGELGVMLLLFFVGMETHPGKLLANWRITFLGTAVQIFGSVALVAVIGAWLDWPLARVVLVGFIITMSSTAVVVSYLRERGQLNSKIGHDSLGILVAQDLALIPMLIVVSLMAGRDLEPRAIAMQAVGFMLTVALVTWLVLGRNVRLPLVPQIRRDHELQIFLAFAVCLGFALVTGLFGLSTALGAFLAGMLIGVARETNWVHRRLEPFRVVFVAVFFVSVGSLLNVPFVLDNLLLVGAVVFAVFIGNTTINAITLRLLGDPWRYAVYAGAHLAQIGEFSFLLAAVGVGYKLLPAPTYQLVIAVIAFTLLLSPAWIAVVDYAQGRVTKFRSRRR